MDNEKTSNNCQTTTGHDQMQRLYIWVNGRSLGTIFLKWLSTTLKDAQVINGIFTSSYFYGSDFKCAGMFRERLVAKANETSLSEFPSVYDGSAVTYAWAKSQLECEYPGKKQLICKDLPFALCGDHELIPKGFRHTFLIRHPYKMFPSWKRSIGQTMFPTLPLTKVIDDYYSGFYNYKEQYELLKYLQEHPELGDANPVVMDTDDLLNHPARMLSQYCQDIGIPYTDDMLKWEPGTEVVKNSWMISSQLCGGGLHSGECGFYKTAMKSSHFMAPKKLPDRCELDEDMLTCADIAMPHYNLMYDMRTIRP